jgi:uncharacterized protein with ParB-like and HNH nuclease domain
MKVTPVSKTLADVMRGNFLKIPRFQRPYDWDRDNITEFWNDLKDRSDPQYFMGSIVVFGDAKERNLISLVDGQQRITTITIMLAVLRNALEEFGEVGPAAALHEMIESRDLDNKSRFVLEHDPSDKYFQYAVQSRVPDKKVTPEGLQQDNLQSAFKYLDGVLRDQLKSSFSGAKSKAIDYLKHLRDCLLQMHFISIELDNEDDAYLIFETLNTRGKDLRPSDLLKNHFMRLLPTKVKGLDYAKNTWSEVIEKLHSVTSSIDTDSFLLHYWMSRESSVSKSSLFIHYKNAIKKNNAKTWLDEIKQASTTYIRCLAPTEVQWAKEERAIRESLQALRVFGVAQAAPLMLAIMSQYERKVISLKSTRQAFELIENFAFQFNALTQSRGGGGVSNMYARLAQNTTACSTAQDFVKVSAEMREKFDERIPDELEFILPFSRLTYRSSYTRDRALIRYVLTKLSRHFGLPVEVDVNMLTIEHILPQSKGEETGDEFDVGAIGNLIFLNEALNGSADDKDFTAKKKYYIEKNNVFSDDYLRNAVRWTEKDIADRGIELGRIGYNHIWRI